MRRSETKKSDWLKKDKRYRTSVGLSAVEAFLAMSISFTIFAVVLTIFEHSFNTRILRILTITVAGICVIRMINYATGYTLGQVGGSATSRNIRLFLGDKFKRMPLKRFVSIETGEIISAVTTETGKYEKILTHKIGDVVKTSISLALIMVCFIIISPILGLCCLALIAALTPFYLQAFKNVGEQGKQRQEIVNDNVSDILEYLNGIQTIRSYGLSGDKNKKLASSLKQNRDINFLMELTLLPIGAISTLLAELSVPVTIIAGGIMWSKGRLDIIVYVISVLLAFFLTQAIAPLFEELVSIKDIRTSKKLLDKLANADEETRGAAGFAPSNYDITLEGVNFSYEKGQGVLKDISFTAKQGQLTALVGDSGSGKSTILNLISRYYDINGGSIAVGNENITEISGEKVLSKISTVYQDVFLFNDSLINNIRFARPDASEDEIVEACKLANCHDFITGFDKGYQTLAGQNGDRLSGGEKQRLSIARAIIRNAPILLLDEATTSLDIENELLVKDAITKLMRSNRTVIMIAHKLSSIRHADHIVVLSGGRVVEQGSHEKLLNNKSKYHAMWEAERQLSL